MKKLLALEEVAQLAIALVALYYQPVGLPVWAWVLLFFAPDMSMLGYLASPRVGAWAYNLAHHKAVAGALVVSGWMFDGPVVLLAGCLLYAHSAFDRALGYGLKQQRGFAFTHLGVIGKGKGGPVGTALQ